MSNKNIRKFTVVVIGSGFSGLCAAISLKARGIEDFVILERRSFMGGTWCQNTYPGAAVDVPSHLYSFSFEPYEWTQVFASQEELKQYTNHVIDKHRLRDRTLLCTNVDDLRWDEGNQNWEIRADHGIFMSRFVIVATGGLSKPMIPDFHGLGTFTGTSFHTNAWDHSFDYKGKRVAVIGSGASSVQVVPAIAPDVKELHVFQRTPHWVLPRPDRTFGHFEKKLLRVPFFRRLVRQMTYLWRESYVSVFKGFMISRKFIAERRAKNLLKNSIKDDELRSKVTPDFVIGCKRVLLSNTIYPTYQRDNVFLYSREEATIQAITPSGILTKSGCELELDLIVYATGYDVLNGMVPFAVCGKDGIKLQHCWDPLPHAYLGATVPNFPNLFITSGPNIQTGHTSTLVMIEAQMHYIMTSISEVLKNDAKYIEVKQEAEEEYNRMIQRAMKRMVWKTGGCHSWYQNKDGDVMALYPGFSFTFVRMAKNFRPNHHYIR